MRSRRRALIHFEFIQGAGEGSIKYSDICAGPDGLLYCSAFNASFLNLFMYKVIIIGILLLILYPLAMPGALFFDGWEGASATIFDCDGTYLANVTLEDLDRETV